LLERKPRHQHQQAAAPRGKGQRKTRLRRASPKAGSELFFALGDETIPSPTKPFYRTAKPV
jgi:hypothetical protein